MILFQHCLQVDRDGTSWRVLCTVSLFSLARHLLKFLGPRSKLCYRLSCLLDEMLGTTIVVAVVTAEGEAAAEPSKSREKAHEKSTNIIKS